MISLQVLVHLTIVYYIGVGKLKREFTVFFIEIQCVGGEFTAIFIDLCTCSFILYFSGRDGDDEPLRVTKKRLIRRLRDGEKSDDIFDQLFEDEDVQALEVLPTVTQWVSTYNRHQQMRADAAAAKAWLSRDQKPWEVTMNRVIITYIFV